MQPDLFQEALALRTEQARLQEALHSLGKKIDALSAQFPEPRTAAATPECARETAPAPSRPSPPPLPPPLPATTAPKRESTDSLEVRIGSVWMVRIGILLLLTGLVFLGNHAFHLLALHSGPAVRLILLAAGGAVLLAAGQHFEKRNGPLGRFGQALSAGGAATLYYCAHAAHAVPALRVVSDPVAGKLLQAAASAGLILLADRKNSESLAVLLVALSGWSAGLQTGGWAQVLLAAVSLVLLFRRGWGRVFLTAVPSTLLGLVWLQNRWPWSTVTVTMETFWHQTGPALACWALFTIGCLLARMPAGSWRIMAFTTNNALLLSLVAPGAAMLFPKGGAWFCLLLGLILLALFFQTRWHQPSLRSACLAQALLALTAALLLFAGGHQTPLILALEAAALSELSLHSSQKRVFKAGSLLCALLTLGAGLRAAAQPESAPWLCAPPALFLLGTAWRTREARGLMPPVCWDRFAAPLTAAGLALFLAVLNRLPATHSPGWMALLALACACSLPVLRFPELAGIGMALLLPAFGLLFHGLHSAELPGIALILTVAGSTLLLPAVFHRQKVWPWASENAAPLSVLPGGLLALFLHLWIPRAAGPDGPGAAFLVAECGFLAAGVLSAQRWAALPGLSLGVMGVLHLAFACCSAPHGMGTIAAPGAVSLGVTLQALLAGSLALTGTRSGMDPRGHLLFRLQLGAATLLGFLWSLFFLPQGLLLAGLTTVGAAGLVLAARHRHGRGMAWAGCVLGAPWAAVAWRRLALGFAHELLPCGRVGRSIAEWIQGDLSFSGWAAILLLLGCQQALRRWTGAACPGWAHRCLLGTGLGMLWWNTHQTVAACGLRGWITVAWSVTGAAILAAGLVLRERFHRRAGLALLGISVGRAFLVDVWRFDTLYRILSFLVLGMLLILFSYFYNRLAARQESHRDPESGQAS